jgi:hypothetical protein
MLIILIDYVGRQIPGLRGGTLYRLSVAILVRRSGFFKTLFSLPRDAHAPSLEGTNDEHPIVLYGIEQVDFDRLMGYMIGG